MSPKVTCRCGASFGRTDLSGVPRTQCPVCRQALDNVPALPTVPPQTATNPPSTIAPLPPAPPTVAQESTTSRATAFQQPPVAALPVAAARQYQYWRAPADLVNHFGERVTANRRFLWDPPAEIGPILSANSNVVAGQEPSPAQPWIMLAIVTVATYLVMGEGLQIIRHQTVDPMMMRLMGLGLAALCGLLSLLWVFPNPPTITYVGTLGAAQLTGRWGQPQPQNCQVILFRDTAAVFTGATHVYKNSLYQHTNYWFRWHSDPSTKATLELVGTHYAEHELPPTDHDYHFGQEVEAAFTEALLQRHLSSQSFHKEIAFPCQPSFGSTLREIRLGNAQVTFVYKSKTETIPLASLGKIDAHRGVLQIDRADTSWFSTNGKFRINYSDLGNAKLFLYYLSMLAGGQART